MENYVEIVTRRDAYSAADILERGTMTAQELAEFFQEIADTHGDIPVVLSFDSGYTYGGLNSLYMEVIESEDSEEEEDY